MMIHQLNNNPVKEVPDQQTKTTNKLLPRKQLGWRCWPISPWRRRGIWGTSNWPGSQWTLTNKWICRFLRRSGRKQLSSVLMNLQVLQETNRIPLVFNEIVLQKIWSNSGEIDSHWDYQPDWKSKDTQQHWPYLCSHGKNFFEFFCGAHQPILQVIYNSGWVTSGVTRDIPTLISRVAEELKIYHCRI